MAEIRINSTGELKLYDSDDSNYVSFKSAGTVSSDVAWVLPSADGSSGQALTTDGSGTLSWATASSADPSSADDLAKEHADVQKVANSGIWTQAVKDSYTAHLASLK